MATLATVSGTTRHSLADRGHDLYETPPEATRALLHIEPGLPERIWEPACGPGAMARVLRAAGHTVLATDLVDYESPDQDAAGIDFLFPMNWASDPIAAFRPGAIVTNPPFKLAAEFAQAAIERAPRVCLLLRLAFLEGERRRAWFERSHLARVHIASRRIPMMHRNGWDGPRIGNSGMAFAWFVFDVAHRGPASIGWFDWKEAAE